VTHLADLGWPVAPDALACLLADVAGLDGLPTPTPSPQGRPDRPWARVGQLVRDRSHGRLLRNRRRNNERPDLGARHVPKHANGSLALHPRRPAAGGAGALLGLGTNYGLVRYWWVVAKIPIAAALIATDAVLVTAVAPNATVTGQPTPAL